MRGLTDRRVIHAEVAPHGAHDDFPRVEANADLHRNTGSTLNLLRVPLHGLLHTQRGVTRADRVILVSDRRPEERHDPVAHDLVDRALVAVDGVHHAFQDGVEQLPRLLGVAVRQQLHRPLHVGEKDGDLLALALKRGLRGEDARR